MSFKLIGRRSFGLLLMFGTLLFALTAAVAQANVGVLVGEGSFTGRAEVSSPKDLAVSPDGKSIYIVESLNHRVLRFNTDNNQITPFAGGPRVDGVAHDHINPGNALLTQLNSPKSVAVSSGGTVYVSDVHNNRVLRISPGGDAVALFAGGQVGSAIDEHDATATQLRSPQNLAVSPDGGWVYIADADNNRVLRVRADGASVERFMGGEGVAEVAQTPAQATKLSSPRGIATSPDGAFVYVSDRSNNQVLRVSADGQSVKVFAGGWWGQSLDVNSATGTPLNFPEGLSVSADGNTVFISDVRNKRVLAVRADGLHVELVIGAPRKLDRGSGSRKASATLRSPQAVTAAPGGSLLIADTQNDRILFVGPNGEFTRKLNALIDAEAESELRLLAAPAGGVLRTLSRGAAGLDSGNEGVRGQQLSGAAQRVPARIDSQPVMPQDVWRIVAAFVAGTDPVHAFRRLQAQLAVQTLESLLAST